MDKKMRVIVFGLAILFVVSIFISLRLYNEKQVSQNEFAQKEKKWQKENEDMVKNLSSAEQERLRLQDKMAAVQKDLDVLARERDDWKQKFELVNKEKEVLAEELQKQPGVTTEVATAKEAPMADEYWAKVLKEKAGLEIQLKDLDGALKNSRLELVKVKDEKQATELEFSNLQKVREDLERKLEYNEKLAKTLSNDLVREKLDKNSLLTQLKELQKDNSAMRAKLKTKEKANLALMERLNKIEADKETLDSRITDMDLAIQSKMDEMVNIKKEIQEAREGEEESSGTRTVELPPIVVKGSPRASVNVVAKEGKVIAVNTENNFIVVDLGEADGARIGNIFKVYRADKQVAIVEVIQTRRNISALDIRQVESNNRIRVGDIVR